MCFAKTKLRAELICIVEIIVVDLFDSIDVLFGDSDIGLIIHSVSSRQFAIY